MRVNITQKPMSFKIDLDILPRLEAYCSAKKLKKNAVINQAIKKFLGATK